MSQIPQFQHSPNVLKTAGRKANCLVDHVLFTFESPGPGPGRIWITPESLLCSSDAVHRRYSESAVICRHHVLGESGELLIELIRRHTLRPVNHRLLLSTSKWRRSGDEQG